MNLYKHQKRIVEKAPEKHILAWEMGTGKTIAALELAKLTQNLLVICPKSLKEQWKENMKFI